MAEAETLLSLPEVASLRAVQTGRFWVVDANALYSRLGPRVVEAAEVLAAILHGPEAPRAGLAVRMGARAAVG
ncbi:hypothetical protein D3C72_2305990 [compost metagenome]